MIITVGGIKGGCGKTTVSTSLAIEAAKAGYDVLLVDADDQQTAATFTQLRVEQNPDAAAYTCIRLTGKAVMQEVKNLSPKHDVVIIDVGGRDTNSQRAALVVSDVALFPFVPSSFDVWTLEQAEELVIDSQIFNENLKAFSFLNKAHSQGKDNQEAGDMLRESRGIIFLDTPLGNRKAFQNAQGEGLSVTEQSRRNPKAVNELALVFEQYLASYMLALKKEI